MLDVVFPAISFSIADSPSGAYPYWFVNAETVPSGAPSGPRQPSTEYTLYTGGEFVPVMLT
jgi:predicted ribosome quality control (RQC) complex YloA/Tae2 family protein